MRPNIRLSLFVLLLLITNTVSAQQVIPLSADKGDNLSVFLDNIQFTSISGTNSYGLKFRFVVMGSKLPRTLSKEHTDTIYRLHADTCRINNF